jgi:hypothetical protein
MNVKPSDLLHGNVQKYLTAVDKIRWRGMEPELTIEQPGKNPKPGLVRLIAKKFVADFGDRVDRVSIFNEPNYSWAWVKPELYRREYNLVYSTIKATHPNIRVYLGELAPLRRKDYVAYLRTVLCLGPYNWPMKRCEPVRADGFATHGYQFTHRPKMRTNAMYGIGWLRQLSSLLKGAERAGSLILPGRKPPILVTEFGYSAPPERRSVPNRRRADWILEGLNLATRSPGVKQLLLYQLYPSEPGYKWDSSIVDQNGRPTDVYLRIQQWEREHPQSVDAPRSPIGELRY